MVNRLVAILLLPFALAIIFPVLFVTMSAMGTTRAMEFLANG